MFDSRVMYAMKDRHINCVENPHNIDPAVEGILDAIEKGKVKAKQKGQPLVVLMGENHASPICYMMHIAVISRLLNVGENIRVGHEISSGALLKRIRQARTMPPTKGFARAINKAFSHPDIWPEHLRNGLDEKEHGRASMALLFDILQDKGLALDSNDHPLSFDSGVPVLDSETYYYDKNWVKAFQARKVRGLISGFNQAFPFFENGISAVSRTGMSERNFFMAEKIKQEISTHSPDIYIQMTGRAHVVGNSEYPYDESFERTLRNQGVHVVSVMPEILSDIKVIKQKTFKVSEMPYFIENGVFINGLSGGSFTCNSSNDDPKTMVAEKLELRKIIENSSLDDVITTDDVDASFTALKNRLSLPRKGGKEPKGKGTYFDRVQQTARSIRKQRP